MKKNLILTSLAALVATSAANAASYTYSNADLTVGLGTPSYTDRALDENGKVKSVTVSEQPFEYQKWDSIKKEYISEETRTGEQADQTYAKMSNYAYLVDTNDDNVGDDLFKRNNLNEIIGEYAAKDVEDFQAHIDKEQNVDGTAILIDKDSLFGNKATYDFTGDISSNIISANDYTAKYNGETVNMNSKVFDKKVEDINLLDMSSITGKETDGSFYTDANRELLGNATINFANANVSSIKGELNKEVAMEDIVLHATNGLDYHFEVVEGNKKLVDSLENSTAFDEAFKSGKSGELIAQLTALENAVDYVFGTDGTVETAEKASALDEDTGLGKVYAALKKAYNNDKKAMDTAIENYKSYKTSVEMYRSNVAEAEKAVAKKAYMEKEGVKVAQANEDLKNASLMDVINGEAEAAIATSLEEGGAIRNAIDAGDARTLAAANAYTDKKVDTLEKDISGGVAAATALSAVNVSGVSKGEVSVGGGYGYYNGESAVAFGAAMGLTDRWSVNAGAGIASGNDTQVSFRAGTNYKFKLF